MREFMSYVQSAFYDATGWNRDNSYSTLNATADGRLDEMRRAHLRNCTLDSH